MSSRTRVAIGAATIHSWLGRYLVIRGAIGSDMNRTLSLLYSYPHSTFGYGYEYPSLLLKNFKLYSNNFLYPEILNSSQASVSPHFCNSIFLFHIQAFHLK